MELPKEFVLFDLEYSAWEGSQERNWSGPGEHREIIQIGAIRVVASDLSEIDSFLEYVRPEKNPKLSEYIIQLTGISQTNIETRGIPFSDALRRFEKFIGNSQAYSWGRDVDVLNENCELLGATTSLHPEQFIDLHTSLAPILLAENVDIAVYSSGTLIQAFSDAPSLRAHDALNDTRNLLRVLRYVRKYIATTVPN